MISDYFDMAFRNLKERKIRSVLTITGIFIAIFTIFVLLSLSLGLNEAIQEQFELLGTDKFFIQPKGQAGGIPGTGAAAELTIDDVEVVRKINEVEKVTYMNIGNGKIEFNDKTRYYYVAGLPTEDEKELELLFESTGIGVDEGRMLRKDDKKKILMGYDYKYRNLFDKPVKTGNKIEINDVEFEVVGILEAVGNPSDDQQVYISFDDFKEIFNSGERVDFIYVQVKTGLDLKKVAEKTEKELMKARDVDEKTIDFDVSTPEEYLSTFNSILAILTVFLVGIGAISLVVASVGIMNTMHISVLERTREIGTMKAVGARNSDILKLFVIESGIFGLIGGILGLGVGIIIAKIIEAIIAVQLGSNILHASMNPIILFGCIIFAVLVGSISGLIPARQASRLKPVEALRYE